MNNQSNKKNAEIKKENEDLPNLPASSDKIDKEQPMKKQIKKTSVLHDNGKTDNTDEKRSN